MKKTSVYLDEDAAARLVNIAQREGRPQAEILREAIRLYDEKKPDRNFALARLTEDDIQRPPGSYKPASQMTDDELMSGYADYILDDAFGGNPPESLKARNGESGH